MDSINDSDSDFSDIGEDIDNEEVNLDSGPRLNKNGIKVRGADKSWVESHRFGTANDFKESEIAQRLDKEFSMRKTREYDYADVLEYECKFSRRVGFLPCPWKMKVNIEYRRVTIKRHFHALSVYAHVKYNIWFFCVCIWYRNIFF